MAHGEIGTSHKVFKCRKNNIKGNQANIALCTNTAQINYRLNT